MIKTASTAKSLRPSSLHLVISVTITLVFLLLVFHEGEKTKEFWNILTRVSIGGVAFYALLSVLGVIIRAVRYRLLLRTIIPSEEVPGSLQLILISFVRNTLVDFLPARAGELGYIYFLNRAGVSLAAATASFGFCIFLDIFVLMLIVGGFIFLSLLLPSLALEHMDIGSTFFALLLVCAFSLMLYLLIKALPRLLLWGTGLVKSCSLRLRNDRLRRWVGWLEENIETIAEDFRKLSEKGVLFRLAWLTFWLRVLKYASLYVLLLAVIGQWGLGMEHIHPLLSMVAFVVAEASASLPISGLMGFGAYETSWSLIFSLSHVVIPETVLVGLVVHLITQLKGYSCGFLAMLLLLLKQPRDYSEDVVR